MFRYVAFAWTPVNRSQHEFVQHFGRRLLASSKDWRVALDTAGLRVFCAGERRGVSEAHVLHNETGVVLGTLFERNQGTENACRKAVLDAAQSASIISTGGRQLVAAYWGRYVAFLCDASNEATYVLRDPVGNLPCMRVHHAGIDVFFSYMEDFLSLNLLTPSINWQYIAAHAVAIVIESRETALNEVSEVLAGESVEIRGERRTESFHWHPCQFAEAGIVEDPEQAKMLMRQTVRQCVHAWASCYGSILHKLSGGLDSSIVLSCLSDAPTRPVVTCVNYRSASSDGDEREFARAAAHRAGFELIEEERGTGFKLVDAMVFARSARPSVSVLGFEAQRAESNTARDRQAEAIFGGIAGDQLFFQNPAMLTAADYARRHGVGPRLFGIALNVAYLDNSSIWSVLRRALRDGLLRRRHDPRNTAQLYRHRHLLKSEIVESFRKDSRYLHPWFRASANVPPGKLNQIYSLAVPLQYYDYYGHPDDAERVEPLLSQPLIELCLRIPTYVLLSGGWDRAIARRAFASDLPEQIIKRRSKGGLQEYVQDVLIDNLEFARGVLLDGALVKQGILDRGRLEEVLSGRPTSVFGGLGEIFDHLSTEAWVRSWTAIEQRAAA